jgi:hypothetical protein
VNSHEERIRESAECDRLAMPDRGSGTSLLQLLQYGTAGSGAACVVLGLANGRTGNRLRNWLESCRERLREQGGKHRVPAQVSRLLCLSPRCVLRTVRPYPQQ